MATARVGRSASVGSISLQGAHRFYSMDVPEPLFLSDNSIAAHGDDPFGRLVTSVNSSNTRSPSLLLITSAPLYRDQTGRFHCQVRSLTETQRRIDEQPPHPNPPSPPSPDGALSNVLAATSSTAAEHVTTSGSDIASDCGVRTEGAAFFTGEPMVIVSLICSTIGGSAADPANHEDWLPADSGLPMITYCKRVKVRTPLTTRESIM